MESSIGRAGEEARHEVLSDGARSAVESNIGRVGEEARHEVVLSDGIETSASSGSSGSSNAEKVHALSHARPAVECQGTHERMRRVEGAGWVSQRSRPCLPGTDRGRHHACTRISIVKAASSVGSTCDIDGLHGGVVDMGGGSGERDDEAWMWWKGVGGKGCRRRKVSMQSCKS